MPSLRLNVRHVYVQEVDEYVNMISDCFEAQLGVMIMRGTHRPGMYNYPVPQSLVFNLRQLQYAHQTRKYPLEPRSVCA